MNEFTYIKLTHNTTKPSGTHERTNEQTKKSFFFARAVSVRCVAFSMSVLWELTSHSYANMSGEREKDRAPCEYNMDAFAVTKCYTSKLIQKCVKSIESHNHFETFLLVMPVCMCFSLAHSRCFAHTLFLFCFLRWWCTHSSFILWRWLIFIQMSCYCVDETIDIGVDVSVRWCCVKHILLMKNFQIDYSMFKCISKYRKNVAFLNRLT